MNRLNQLLRGIPTWVVWVGLLIPMALLIWDALNNNLGADPVKAVERSLGEVGLKLLVVTLLITPLRSFVGLNLIKFRRAFGVMAFVYVLFHFFAWMSLDLAFRWSEIFRDLYRRPYIIVGMVGLLTLLPLALTSTNAAIRKMGPVAWRRLHRLTYVAALAGTIHYIMLVKGWQIEPLVYFGIVLALLAMRLPRAR